MCSSDPRQPLILIIDDEPTVLGEVAATLWGAGYTCHCSMCGDVALKFVRSQTPDLILCDVNLDGHSGLELCDQIRRLASPAELPVMFLSAAQGSDIIRRGDAGGGTYYLKKPVDAEVLLELVDNCLRKPQAAENHLEFATAANP